MATYNFAAGHLSPRRGSKATMTTDPIKKAYVLAAGELFLEYDGTLGSCPVRVKVGDGTTDYEHLSYAIDTSDISGTIINYTDNTKTTVAAALADGSTGHSIAQIVAALKQAIYLTDDAAIYSMTVDGNAITVTDNAVSFDSPDYALAVTSATSGVTVTLDAEAGYGKTDSAFDIIGSGLTIATDGSDITITHPVSGVTAGSYASVTVDTNGHVTAGSTMTSGLAVVSDANGLPTASTVTATELGYLSSATSNIQAQIDGKAAAVHTHVAADITDNIPVTMLTSGANGEKISIDLIPHGALERLVPTADEASMRALTADDVQVGDTVKRVDTGVMYFCTKSEGLPVGPTGDISEFFDPYTAGEASAVEWSNVQNRPGDFTGATSTSSGAYGFVPAPTSGQEGYFLAGDGSWTEFATFTGSGTTGFVPASTSSDTAKYLKGDGTWDTPTDTTYGLATTADIGLMPALSTAANVYLQGDGTWGVVPAATTAAGGLMPALSTASNVYLQGDGTWGEIAAATTAAGGLMPALSTANNVVLAGDGSWIEIGTYDFGDEG